MCSDGWRAAALAGWVMFATMTNSLLGNLFFVVICCRIFQNNLKLDKGLQTLCICNVSCLGLGLGSYSRVSRLVSTRPELEHIRPGRLHVRLSTASGADGANGLAT